MEDPGATVAPEGSDETAVLVSGGAAA